MSKFWGLLFFWGKNRRRPPGLGTQGFMYHPSLAWLACLALACLAILASYRPRSPCLHQQQRPRREAPRRPPKAAGVVVAWCRQGERGRNEAMDSQASQGQPSNRGRIVWDLGLEWIFQNGLIGPLTAPNDVPISSPSGKFRGDAKYGAPGAPETI